MVRYGDMEGGRWMGGGFVYFFGTFVLLMNSFLINWNKVNKSMKQSNKLNFFKKCLYLFSFLFSFPFSQNRRLIS